MLKKIIFSLIIVVNLLNAETINITKKIQNTNNKEILEKILKKHKEIGTLHKNYDMRDKSQINQYSEKIKLLKKEIDELKNKIEDDAIITLHTIETDEMCINNISYLVFYNEKQIIHIDKIMETIQSSSEYVANANGTYSREYTPPRTIEKRCYK